MNILYSFVTHAKFFSLGYIKKNDWCNVQLDEWENKNGFWSKLVLSLYFLPHLKISKSHFYEINSWRLIFEGKQQITLQYRQKKSETSTLGSFKQTFIYFHS